MTFFNDTAATEIYTRYDAWLRQFAAEHHATDPNAFEGFKTRVAQTLERAWHTL